MSLVEHFLPRHLQTPSNIKYFHSLLSTPLSKLHFEKVALQGKIEKTERDIKTHSVQESRDFVSALGSTVNLAEISQGLEVLLHDCVKATKDFQASVLEQSQVIDRVLAEQQKLENLSNLSSVISDILEIPQLLRNLMNSKHYKEAIDLLCFAEGIQSEGKVFDDIRKAAAESRARIGKEIRKVVLESFDPAKIRECRELIGKIEPGAGFKDILLSAKLAYYRDTVSRHRAAHWKLAETIRFLNDFLAKFLQVYEGMPEDSESLTGFYIDLVSDVFLLFSNYSFSSLAELSEVASALDKANREYFIKLGCDIWPSVFKVIEGNIKAKLSIYRKKTVANYENLLKLYGWQVVPNQSSPLQEFGSISVLYNNCLIIINEVRSGLCRKIPVCACKEKFYEEIAGILKGAGNAVVEKSKSLGQGKHLNKQEELMKGLMERYVEVSGL